MFVVAFAEFFSDEVNIHLIISELLLWKYDLDKVKVGYVSDNDDPLKLKSYFTPQQQDDLVHIN